MSAINSMCYRAIKCLKNKETLKKELGRIKNIIRNNKYKPNVIENIVKKINKRIEEGARDEGERKKNYRGAIMYIGWETEKIRKCLKKI